MKTKNCSTTWSIAAIIPLALCTQAFSAGGDTTADAPSGVIQDIYFLDHLPQWLIFIILIAISLLAIETGHRLGIWRNRKGHEPEGPLGTVVAAVLALFAFIIALSFSAAGNRFEERKQALLEEVNAIGTAYLRAGLIPEPQSSNTRRLLRDYVEIRLGMYQALGREETMKAIQNQTERMQQKIWSQVTELVQAGHDSPVTALFISSINEVFDMHTARVVLGAEFRIPPLVWYTLALVTILAMGTVGYFFGMGGKKSLFASIALSMSFALVILLIYDFDKPGEGLIVVNQQPMLELYESLEEE